MSVTVDNNRDLFQLVPSRKETVFSSSTLTIGRYLVGRTESCDVIIPSNVVSAVHAVLEVVPNGIKIYDMNSKNGTFVNGNKVVVQDVQLGDILSFGNIEFSINRYSSSSTELPPVLETLDSIKGSARTVNKELPKRSPVQETPTNIAYDKKDDVPYIVYPLSSDPNSDFSEYIFEDADQLYPIFKYELNKQAVEVIILHNDKVYAVDYLPAVNKKYQIAGLAKKKDQVEFPYLAKDEKVDFIEVQNNNIIVSQLQNYELMHLTDSEVKVSKSGQVHLDENDIVKLQKGNLEIYVRKVSSPPKVKTPPFFRRDTGLGKYLFLMFIFLVLPFIFLNYLEVDKEKLKNKPDLERVATILYKQKLTLNTNKTIEKTEKKPVKKQTAPKKPVVKKSEPKKNQATAKKSDLKTKPVENPGESESAKAQKVKQAKNPAKRNKVIAKGQTNPKSKTKSTKSNNQRRSNVQSNNKGRVETYKSFDFKSSVTNLMAKGGSLRGAKTAASSSSSISSANVGGGTSDVAKANVASDPGSLVGSKTGKTGIARGTRGFSNKRGVYTAGIPSETVVLGSMDPDTIRRILRNHIPQFRGCYQRELDRNANKDISGMIRMVFTIGSSGHVTRAGVDGNSNLPAGVKRCVISVLKGIDEFPRPLGGGTVDVKQPFNFYPKRL